MALGRLLAEVLEVGLGPAVRVEELVALGGDALEVGEERLEGDVTAGGVRRGNRAVDELALPRLVVGGAVQRVAGSVGPRPRLLIAGVAFARSDERRVGKE